MAQQEETKKNITVEEAKAQVYNMVQQGINYREISQVEFLINGRTKKFGISEISKIKKEIEPEISSQVKDYDKALVFKLFKKGRSPAETLIETGFSFNFIKNAYYEFLEFERKTAVPNSFLKKMLNLTHKIFPNTNDYDHIESAMDVAINSHFKLKTYRYLCMVCRKPIEIGEKEWIDAAVYLSQKWGHDECIK